MNPQIKFWQTTILVGTKVHKVINEQTAKSRSSLHQIFHEDCM